MKNFSVELAWLALPVVMLAAFGLVLQHRPPPSPTPPVSTLLASPTPTLAAVLAVEKVIIKAPGPSAVADGYDTEVQVVLNHRGPRPTWWNTSNPVYEAAGSIDLLDQGGVVVGRGLKWHPGYAPRRDRYVGLYQFKLAAIPAGQALSFRDSVAPTEAGQMKCAPLPIQILVRRQGIQTASPFVSHNPRMKMSGWSVQSALAPGGEAQLQIEVHLRTTPGSRYSLRPILKLCKIVNARGHDVSLNFHGAVDNDTWATKTRNGEQTASCHFEVPVSELQKAQGRLWLRAEIYYGSYWPLNLKLPLRDAAGRILIRPRS